MAVHWLFMVGDGREWLGTGQDPGESVSMAIGKWLDMIGKVKVQELVHERRDAHLVLQVFNQVIKGPKMNW